MEGQPESGLPTSATADITAANSAAADSATADSEASYDAGEGAAAADAPALVESMQPFRFRDLPKDIRLMIYERLPCTIKVTKMRLPGWDFDRDTLPVDASMVDPGSDKANPSKKRWEWECFRYCSGIVLSRKTISLAILRTCKQIHEEGSAVAQRATAERFSIDPPIKIVCGWDRATAAFMVALFKAFRRDDHLPFFESQALYKDLFESGLFALYAIRTLNEPLEIWDKYYQETAINTEDALREFSKFDNDSTIWGVTKYNPPSAYIELLYFKKLVDLIERFQPSKAKGLIEMLIVKDTYRQHWWTWDPSDPPMSPANLAHVEFSQKWIKGESMDPEPHPSCSICFPGAEDFSVLTPTPRSPGDTDDGEEQYRLAQIIHGHLHLFKYSASPLMLFRGLDWDYGLRAPIVDRIMQGF